MKSFVILALLFAVTNGATLLGKSSCTWGPSYWCKNMNNAKQCQAVGHCAEKQWNQHVNRESLPCKMCEEVFEVVNGMLEKNSTKQEVEGELMNMCTQLPGSFVSECKMAISENFDLIYDEAVMLLNNGGVFCSALGLCQRASEENLKMNGEMDKLFDQAKEAYKNTQLPAAVVTLTEAQSDECQDCTSFFNDFVDVVKNQKNVVDYWQNLIVQECELLGPGISNLCQEELTKEFTILLNQMAAQDAATVCKDISMCTSSAAKQGASKQCSDCNNFFTDLQNDIANQGQITASIEAMLKKSCDQAPKTLQPVCLSVISQAMEGAWKLIGKNPTESICETLFFCQETKVAVAPVVTNCTDCMNFMTDVKNVALNDPTVVNTLVKLVKQECKRLDEDFEILLCDEYSEDLVRKALHEGQIMDVGAVCTSIEMCSSSPSQGHFGGDVCNDCVRFTQDWKDVLQHDPSYINLRLSMAGKAICQNAGGFLKNICEEKIEDVLRDALVEFNSTSAADECKRVAMCTKQTTADAATVHTVKLHHDKKLKLRYTASIVCETCTAVSQALDKVISKKSTEDQIKAALDQVCSSVPQQFQDACKDLVDVYTPEIIGIIQQGLEGEMCQYLGLCPQKKEEAVKSDLPCDVCITVAKQLDDMITSSSTEAEIEQALGQVCELLPADLRDTCKTLIATYTPQLIDLLMQEISPKEICSTLGLCPESAKKLKVRSEMTCGICLTVATELDKMVKPDDLKADVEKALDMVCGVLPSKDAPLCKEYVSAFAPELIDMLLQELSPKKMCSMLGFCSTTAVAEKSQVVETKVQDSPYCGICMLVAGQLEKSLSKDATKAEIEQALDQVCGLLPGQYKDECDQLVTQYTPMIIQLLVAEVTPKQLCSELKLCPASKQTQSSANPLCAVCTMVATKLDNILSQQSTQAEIEQALDEVCGFLPGQYKDECDQLVTQYTPMIIELLVSEYTPRQLCALMGVCVAQKSQVVETKVQDSPYCGICMLVAGQLEKSLSKDATKAEIEQALDQVCGLLPGQYKDECDQLVTQYTPMIIQLLVAEVTPKQLCSELKLCPASKQTQSSANPLCAVCTMVATKLDSILSQQSTQAEIEQALDEVCGLLPGQYKDECDQLVTQYTPMIIQLLVAEVTPRQLCALMGVCVTQKSQVVESKVQDSPYCGICMLVAGQLEKSLSKDATKAEIEQALDQVCGLLPGQYKDECDQLVTQYTPMIIQLLVAEVTPKQLCSELKLCPASKESIEVKEKTKCEVCRFVVSIVDGLLKKKTTEEEIRNSLQGTCVLLPHTVADHCRSFVANHVDNIMELLKKMEEVSPEHICAMIGSCQPNKAANNKSEENALCEVCTQVAEKLEEFVKEDATEEDIIHALEEVCKFVSGDLRMECIEGINGYTAYYIDVITGKLSPKVLCDVMAVCLLKEENVRSDPECQLCTLVVNELDMLLSENSTKKEVEDALENVCSIIPSDLKSECVEFIDAYTPQILDLLSQKLSPKLICGKLGLCSSDLIEIILTY